MQEQLNLKEEEVAELHKVKFKLSEKEREIELARFEIQTL